MYAFALLLATIAIQSLAAFALASKFGWVVTVLVFAAQFTISTLLQRERRAMALKAYAAASPEERLAAYVRLNVSAAEEAKQD